MDITVEDIIKLIHDKIDKIDNTRVYVCLRTMKIKFIQVKTVENIKICIAINEMKLPITVNLFNYIRGSTNAFNSLICLHILGDKKIITLIRRDSKDVCEYKWILGEAFSNLYYLNKEEKKEDG